MKKLLLSLAIACIWFGPFIAYADESNVPEPNIYEENEIDLNNSLRKDRQQKVKIPDEQKELTFEQSETDTERMEEKLFQSAIEEINPIQVRVAQIGLFSDADERVQLESEAQRGQTSSIIKYMLMIAVIVVLLAIFLLIIPRLQQTDI